MDGDTYVDLVCSWGPMLIGHAHPQVKDAVTAAVAHSTPVGTPSEPEVALAEEVVARTPIEQRRPVPERARKQFTAGA